MPMLGLIAVEGERAKTVDIDRVVEYFSTQIIIDWFRFLASAVFISVTVTIMLNADINVSLDFTVL